MNDEHFNGLSPAEAERLALLVEECGEVIQAVTKILRHGYESCHPVSGVNNRAALERELGDLLFVIGGVVGEGDVARANVDAALKDKADRIAPYLHHQAERQL